MKWTNPGHEFDHMKESILEENVQYYIWGAAIQGTSLYNSFRDKLNVVGFIDTDPKKHGIKIGDVEIYPPERLDHHDSKVKVLIATSWEGAVSKILEEKGFLKDITFFSKNKFISLFQLFKYNKLSQMQLFCRITERCTLKCKHCGPFIPYIQNPVDAVISDILNGLELYFTYVEKLSILNLTGGDPIIHKEFDTLLEEIGERYYNKKIDHIALLTNGIVFPKENTLKLLKKYEVIVHITNYKQATNLQKIEEFEQLLNQYQISYEIITHPHWVDMGYPQESNGLETKEQWSSLFSTCSIPCTAIYGDKLAYCASVFMAERIGYCTVAPNDYLDLSSLKEEEKVKILEFTSGYCEKGYVELCKKCNGSISSNDKIVPVGQQL